MKDLISKNIDNPKELEKLYRENNMVFKNDFNSIYKNIKDNKLAQFWNERLNYEIPEEKLNFKKEYFFLIIATLIGFFITKIPKFIDVNENLFYFRTYCFYFFPALMIYFSIKNKLSKKKVINLTIILILSLIFIVILPDKKKSDTILLSVLHLPVFFWTLLFYTFINDDFKNYNKRIEFLRFNGNLLIFSGLSLLALVLVAISTNGLFGALLKITIHRYYIDYFVVLCLIAIPIFGTHMVRTSPQIVSRISPLFASILTPIVLLTLLAYLLTMFYTGKSPYKNREYLMIYNGIIIAVMAIILFSIAESSKNKMSNLKIYMLISLSLLTILVNILSIGVIIMRTVDFGISPNRIAVFGTNIITLLNLSLVSFRLFQSIKNKNNIERVENSLSEFIPIYSIWAMIIIFLFPLFFWVK